MRRRQFLALVGAAAVWPTLASGQQPALPVIGFMSGRSPDDSKHLLAAFHQGLGDAGFVEGKNVAVEYRWASGQYDRLPALAADLVKRPVTVIAAVRRRFGRCCKTGHLYDSDRLWNGRRPYQGGVGR